MCKAINTRCLVQLCNSCCCDHLPHKCVLGIRPRVIDIMTALGCRLCFEMLIAGNPGFQEVDGRKSL